MAARTLEINPIGFRSGMSTSCAAIADAALALALPARESASAQAPRDLARNELLALPDEDLDLICLSGKLWLTRDGDVEDYVLGAGQSFALRRGDKAAVQALQASRVRLIAA